MRYNRGDHYQLSPVVPVEVSDVEIAFPANVKHLMPTAAEVEKVPKDLGRKCERFAADWFHLGLDEKSSFDLQGDFDPKTVLRHIQCCLGTFESKHEDKMVGVATLVANFFARIHYRPKGAKDWITIDCLGARDKAGADEAQ